MSDTPTQRRIKDLAMLHQIESKLQEIAREIDVRIPPGWGFALLVFEYDGAGCAWVSSAERKSALAAIREWCDRIERGDTGRVGSEGN